MSFSKSPRSFQNTQTIETGHRDYKNFDNGRFCKELLSEIKERGLLNKNKSIFHNVCIEVLEKNAPDKQKYIRVNQANFMDSKLNDPLMLRSKL